jgi:hypothetical protein
MEGKILDIVLLGSPARVTWTRAASGLAVELPDDRPRDCPYVLKIDL